MVDVASSRLRLGAIPWGWNHVRGVKPGSMICHLVLGAVYNDLGSLHVVRLDLVTDQMGPEARVAKQVMQIQLLQTLVDDQVACSMVLGRLLILCPDDGKFQACPTDA